MRKTIHTGMMYSAGQGVPLMMPRRGVCRKAAAQGHIGAGIQSRLSLRRGPGVRRTRRRPRRWYLRAAEHGDSYAQYNVAQRYELAGASPPILWKPINGSDIAAKQGVEDAAESRSRLKQKLSSAELRGI